jgi:hypothetical protein
VVYTLSMLQRIRDAKKYLKRQGHISFEEWQEIENRYAHAKDFFSETNPSFRIMRDDLKNAEDIIIENRLREVHDITQVTDTLRKVFITDRKLQLDELTGQVKYLRGFFREMQSWIDMKMDAERDEADGKLTIDRAGKDETG